MLKAGIVGLPNVGKSTLFNAVTRTRKAEAANYPFCTIDPNVGIVTVPDARLELADGGGQQLIPESLALFEMERIIRHHQHQAGAAFDRRDRFEFGTALGGDAV